MGKAARMCQLCVCERDCVEPVCVRVACMHVRVRGCVCAGGPCTRVSLWVCVLVRRGSRRAVTQGRLTGAASPAAADSADC